MNLGWGELIVILAILLLLFGARRLPELARSIGEAIREFQRASRNDDNDPHEPTEKR